MAKAGQMTGKFKVAGLLAVGAVAGALTTMQFQAVARNGALPAYREKEFGIWQSWTWVIP